MPNFLSDKGLIGLITGEGHFEPNYLEVSQILEILDPVLKRVDLLYSADLKRLVELGREEGGNNAYRRISKSVVRGGKLFRISEGQMYVHRSYFLRLADMQAPPEPFPGRFANIHERFPETVEEVVTSRQILLERSGKLFVWKVEWKSDVHVNEGWHGDSQLRYIGRQSQLREITLEGLAPYLYRAGSHGEILKNILHSLFLDARSQNHTAGQRHEHAARVEEYLDGVRARIGVHI